MRMSHEIFNMEWSNTDSIYLHTRDGLLYSAFADRRKDFKSRGRVDVPAGPSGAGKNFWPFTLSVQERF